MGRLIVIERKIFLLNLNCLFIEYKKYRNNCCFKYCKGKCVIA